MTDDSLLPIHSSCGHRLASLGGKTHHRGQGEEQPSVTPEAVQAAMVADGDLEVVGHQADGHTWFRLTAKGQRRAEQLLGLPAGSLDIAEDV